MEAWKEPGYGHPAAALYTTIDDLPAEPRWGALRPKAGIAPKLSGAEPAALAAPALVNHQG